MKFCTNCGKEISDPSGVCPDCSQLEMASEEQKSNVCAIIGFILSFILPLIGIVFSAIGISKASKMEGNGKGLAIAGLIISIVHFLLRIALIIIVIAAFFNYGPEIATGLDGILPYLEEFAYYA